MKTSKLFKLIAVVVIGFLATNQILAQHKTTFEFTSTAPDQLLRTMEKNTNALFAAIHQAESQNKSELSLSENNMTIKAINSVKNMWGVSHFYCTKPYVITRVISCDKGYQIRNVPIYCTVIDKNHEVADEYRNQHVVIVYDNTGKICDFYSIVSDYDYTDIVANSNEVADDRHIKMIKNFVENFKDAYNNKDIDVIGNMYSEHALIITGKVVYEKNKDDISRSLTKNPKIEYSIKNKQEYLTRLKKAFADNPYINVKFTNIKIIKSEVDPNIYGVTLHQYWRSSGYNDDGRLLLIIDFKDEDHAQIWVRTWEPLKDDMNNKINEEDYLQIGDFNWE